MIPKKFKHNIIYDTDEYTLVKKKLNKAKIKLLVVTNKSHKVIGTITDGDIRRKAGQKILNKVKSIELMNKEPFLILNQKKISKANIIKYHYGVKINSSKKFIEIIDLNSYLLDTKTAAVIMAGGYGKRLLPLTNFIPKPLLEINKKTMLRIIIEKILLGNVVNIFVSLHYMNKKILKEIKEIKLKNKISINEIYEKTPLGTAGALAYLKNTDFENFIICNSDIITDFKFNDILKFHIKKKSDLTVLTNNYQQEIPYGVLHIKDNKIKKIEEKPKLNFKILLGIYIINKKIIKKITKNKRLDMPQLINQSIKNKFNINFLTTNQKIIDVSSKNELFNLNPIYKNYFI
jgi:dTDP-glucose pyrophosphorylase